MGKTKLLQEVTVEGEDLVVSIRNPVSNKVLGSRIWRGAAKYVYATKEFKGKGAVFVLAVPLNAGLEIDDVDLANVGGL